MGCCHSICGWFLLPPDIGMVVEVPKQKNMREGITNQSPLVLPRVTTVQVQCVTGVNDDRHKLNLKHKQHASLKMIYFQRSRNLIHFDLHQG